MLYCILVLNIKIESGAIYMTNVTLSHLDQLLKEFHLSGKQLAEYLNVDYSLVSKWRNEKRRLNSEYIDKIARLFLTLDAKYNYERIEKLLSKNLSEEEKGNEEQILSYFELWLSSKNPEAEKNAVEKFMSRKAQKHTYYVFQGSEGRRDAINTFLDYVISNQGLNLWLFSQEDNQWFSEDEKFQMEWQNKNFKVLNNHNFIHVIHPIERRHKQVAQSMYRWIPIHLMGNAMAYYLPQYWDPEIKITIFLAENLAVLVGVTSEKHTKKTVTYLFTDTEVLQNAKDVLMELFHQSTQMFEQYGFEGNGRFFSAFKKIVENSNPVYYFSGAPILYMISESYLQKALLENHFTEEENEKYTHIMFQCSLEYMRNISNLSMTYIIHIKQLEKLLKMEKVMMRFLSHCLGRPFYVTQEMFRKLLIHSMETICASDNLFILLTERSMLNPYEEIALFVKKKEVAGFVGTDYESEAGARALITREDSVVSSLYYSCLNFVKSHRTKDMEKQNVREIIMSIIKKIN